MAAARREPALRLRPWRPADAREAVLLIRRALGPAEAASARRTFAFHAACRARGIDDGRTYIVLCEGESLAGLAGLHHYAWGPRENVWLGWFAVDPARQGLGLGAHLLAAAEKRARAQGRRRFFIETYKSPAFANARRLYARAGFRISGRVSRYLRGADMIVYAKDLK